jgi:eukaryotic-like serine/threonine-protein kinase
MRGAALREGALVGTRFELDRLLGEGGMGEVWSARDVSNGERRALKFLKGTSASDERRRRFLREGRAAMTLRHPNVVMIHSVEEGDEPFLVMDLLDGETMREHLDRRKRLSLGEALSVLMPVISAVGAAHALGIVHRDLKPENVFLTPTGDVRVLDFGVAKFAASISTPNLTESGDRLGTPRYMAPEQARGARDVDHRVDIWALGVMLWEALEGRHPIAGENVGAIYRAITFDPIPKLGVDVPAEVRDLITSMLERDVAKRPRDLREIVDVLAKHYDGAPPTFGAPAVDEEERSSRRSMTTIDETYDGTTVPTRARSSRGMWIAIVVALLAALVMYGVYRRGAASGPPSTGSP